MASPAVLLDANVLYSAPLRDLLLQLASSGAYRAYWSAAIQDEWIGHLLLNRPDLSPERLQRTRLLMETAFPDSLVEGYESLIPDLQLPDPDDRHVLAAAIHAKANFIITKNLVDFSDTVLQEYHLMAIHPDSFLLKLTQSTPEFVYSAVQTCRTTLKKPPKTVEEYLAILEKQGLKRTVLELKNVSELL